MRQAHMAAAVGDKKMNEFECKICSKKFETAESLIQHNSSKHAVAEIKKDRTSIKKYLLIAAILIAFGLIAYTFYFRAQQPGQYDEFTKCLTEKGIKMYGNDACQYTTKQRNMFGNSELYLNYIKCTGGVECDIKKVKITPTWEINGTMLEGVQSFEKLSELSGCKL